MPVTIRTASGELVTGELVHVQLSRFVQQHMRDIYQHWQRNPDTRRQYRSFAVLILWWDQTGMRSEADVNAAVQALGLDPFPGQYAGTGPWNPFYNPNQPFESGIDWRTL